MQITPPYSPTVWKIIISCALGLVLLGAVFWFSKTIQKAWFNHKMTQANANLVKELDKLTDIQKQKTAQEKALQQANIDEAVQKEKVIQAAKDAEAASKAEVAANTAADQANANTVAINAQDFNGTSLENANKARCRAFPESPDCQ